MVVLKEQISHARFFMRHFFLKKYSFSPAILSYQTMPLNNFLTTTFINGSERRGEDLPETMHISRHEYPAWIEEQKQNSCIRYYETTNGRPGRLFKNRNCLLNGYTPSAASSDEHPAKRARGRRGFIFNQHFKCRFSKICGCQAGFSASVDENDLDKEIITISFSHSHTGHNPFSPQEIANGPLPPSVSTFIKQQGVLSNILENEDYDQMPLATILPNHYTQALLEYFEREYIPKKTNWSNAWRHGNYNVNTNNYVESWHRQLKEGYMSGLRRQRNILWDMVLPDVMQDYLRIKANFSPRRLNKAERQRLQRARALSEEEAEAKILGQDDNIIKVASFTDDNITYDVTIDISDNCVLACTCDDQQNSNSPCKHMFLVNRVLGIGLVRIQGQPSEPVAATDIEVQNNNEHTTESSLTIRNDAYNRFADTFSQLQIEVGKTNEQQRVPPRIINNLATSFISHIQKLKSWNSNPQGPTDHQQRY
ncbi:hypothetical protein BX666DRAFT_2126350 [Dichotomocladium elegans]|nr:hypothetical protein BX666DRAFT_2126350 [Dichotomocladium elegans]